MVTHIATCGDSFGCGAGLTDDSCYEKSFAGVVAEKFNLPQRVYARSGCCNFTIYLQVKKIIEQASHDKSYRPLVLITTTFHERLIFPTDNGFKFKTPDLADVEYLSYVPYVDNKRPLEFKTNTSRLSSETVSNIQHYQTGNAPNLARLFANVNKQKLNAIGQYYLYLFDTGIKKDYDEALFVTMHMMLESANLPHVIMACYPPLVIPAKNAMHNDWGFYSKNYPDEQGSGHCNEVGNLKVGNEVISHIEKYKLI
jgi:hypothetical protein